MPATLVVCGQVDLLLGSLRSSGVQLYSALLSVSLLEKRQCEVVYQTTTRSEQHATACRQQVIDHHLTPRSEYPKPEPVAEMRLIILVYLDEYRVYLIHI